MDWCGCRTRPHTVVEATRAVSVAGALMAKEVAGKAEEGGAKVATAAGEMEMVVAVMVVG